MIARAIVAAAWVPVASAMAQDGGAAGEPESWDDRRLDWIDHDLLMRDHTDRVVDGTDAFGAPARVLVMGDGVVATCNEAGGCEGTDANGEVGCTFSYFTVVVSMVRRCPAFGTPDQRAAVERAYDRMGAFVYGNGYPARAWMDVRPVLDAALAGAAPGDLPACPSAGSVQTASMTEDWSGILAHVASPAYDAEPDRLLSRPRLSVTGPCH
jgi:hypothetical protein